MGFALAACGGSTADDTKAGPAKTVTVTATVTARPSAALSSASVSTPAGPPSEAEILGNAATNPACKLLTVEQVAANSGLAVTGIKGLPGSTANGKNMQNCTWFLDPKYVQSSLVVQYTVYPEPPKDIVDYYKSVIKQGYGKLVPNLGTIAKVDKHVVDAVYRRAEIHVTLLVHAESTAADMDGAIQLMRLVMKGIKQ